MLTLTLDVAGLTGAGAVALGLLLAVPAAAVAGSLGLAAWVVAQARPKPGDAA